MYKDHEYTDEEFEEEFPDRGKNAMSAYYYGFDETGVEAIDRILKAVAVAGKRYHRTEYWNDRDYGPSVVDHIQWAAEKAAERYRNQETLLDEREYK